MLRSAFFIITYLITGCLAMGQDSNFADWIVKGAPDPTAIEAADGSGQYVFHTGKGIAILHRRNGEPWKKIGRVFDEDVPTWAKQIIPGADSIWAPDIHLHNDTYYLYYCVSTFGSQRSVVGLAVNKSLDPQAPDYRWEDQGLVIESFPGKSDFNAIDPAVFHDGDRAFMTWGSYWSGIKGAEIDPATGKPDFKRWPMATIAGRAPNADKSIEAPFVIKHKGMFYLFVSWGVCCQYEKSTYKIMVGRSKSPLGPYVDDTGQAMVDGGGRLVVMSDQDWRGPGHNSVIQSDDGDYLFYHAIEASDPLGGRKLAVRKIVWQDGWPVVETSATNEKNVAESRSVVGRWEHVVNGGNRSDIFFEPAGPISGFKKPGEWKLTGRKLQMKWPDNNAPGGAWIDNLQVAPDFLSYSGTNNIGSIIEGRKKLAATQDPIIRNKNQFAQNPVIWSDVPDVSVVRVDDTYFMASTTMHMNPGLPIMKSKDLVNWELVSYAYEKLTDNDAMSLRNGQSCYGRGSWAPSIRYHEGVFYVSTFSNTSGKTHIYTTKDPESEPWVEHSFSPSLHDHSLFFDDGKVFAIYGVGEIRIVELESDLSGVKTGGVNRILIREVGIPAGKNLSLRGEGSQLLKVDGKYYLLNIAWPRRGMRTVVVHRADSLDGPWEGRLGLQDKGVAQGCLIDSPDGKWYAFLFQDNGSVGRTPWVVPVTWEDGWPVFGIADMAPVTVDIPAGSQNLSGIGGIVASDEFSRDSEDRPLPLAWQWNHNPVDEYWSLRDRPGMLRLTTGRIDSDVLQARNTLTQRTFGPESTATTSIDVSNMKPGDVAGLIALQKHYGYIGVKASTEGKSIVLVTHPDKEPVEIVAAHLPEQQTTVGLKIDCDFKSRTDKAYFHYSLNGNEWIRVGAPLQMRYTIPQFMGYRFGLFNFATREPGGYVDFDYYRVNAGDDSPPVKGKHDVSESGKDVILFPYFDSNGENGVYLCWSDDGYEFHKINEGRPVFTPPQWKDQNLTRDPSIVYAQGKFHMVWTSHWNGQILGYASSPDLKQWSEAKQIMPFAEGTEQPKNVWAPELLYDQIAGDYKIIWSSTLPSELADKDGSADSHGYDHRIYFTVTRDFESFSKPKPILPDPGYSVIDAHVIFDNRSTENTADDRWLMSFKKEISIARGGKNISLAVSPPNIQPESFRPIGQPIAGPGTAIKPGSMAEGASIVKWNGQWHLYWDSYQKGYYSLAVSNDLETWQDVTDKLNLPVRHPRHGTMFVVKPAKIGWSLKR